PEVLHNSLVGWDAIAAAESARYATVLLDWTGAPPLLRRASRYLERLLVQRRVRVIRVPLGPEERLEAIVTGLALGDHVSLFLAEERRVDPYPIDAITRLKSALAERAPR
ncbi:MAG: SIS domain-containing protein, partial [Thermoplasmata archaeon]